MKNLVIICILSIFLVLPGCKFKKDPRIGTRQSADWIQVLAGNEFDIKLHGGERIHAFLRVGTPPQAKEKVTKLINKSVSPEVIFRSKIDKGVDKGWVVDLELGVPVCDGSFCSLSETNLADWLKANHLAWE